MSNNNVFDDALFSILKECKTLPTFLDAVFGFLRRRTDFYVVTTDPKGPVGLPPGWAENFVKQAFFKWKPQEKNEPEILSENEVPQPVVETEIECDDVTELPNAIDEDETKITENPQSTKNIEPQFISSECYNGAAYENYSWSQTITDIDIIIKLPKNVMAKNLIIDIAPQKIHVALKGIEKVLLSGNLCQKIKHNDLLWTIENRKLQIHLDKVQESWWDCLIQSETKIDVSKIDCSRPFEELPEDAQAKIEELAWNQDRKMQGLPTSEELAMHETLKKAWNAEGSPFSGPFDPSKVVIN